MAVVDGSSVTVWDHSSNGALAKDSSGNVFFTCKIACVFTGTYAQADDARIQNVHTAIADSLRSDRTITPVSAGFARPGLEAGTAIGATTVAVSGNNITLVLTGADMSTEHASAALGTMTEPISFWVTYKTTVV